LYMHQKQCRSLRNVELKGELAAAETVRNGEKVKFMMIVEFLMQYKSQSGYRL
jgi:hypothetical protein